MKVADSDACIEDCNTIVQYSYPSDIDECELSNGGCEHHCSNLIGSYGCSCDDGFVLNSDSWLCTGKFFIFYFYNFLCYISPSILQHRLAHFQLGSITIIIDINECELSNGGCDQRCTNIPGSYRCTCIAGYNLNSGSRICEGTYIYIADSEACMEHCSTIFYILQMLMNASCQMEAVNITVAI